MENQDPEIIPIRPDHDIEEPVEFSDPVFYSVTTILYIAIIVAFVSLVIYHT